MGNYVSLPYKRVLSVVTVLVSAAVYGIYSYQRSLIYVSRFPEGSRTVVDTPDQYGMAYREVEIETADGVKLQTYVIEASGAKKTVLMLNPNAGNIGHALPLARQFVEGMGFNVVLFSYRGYGKSTGEASETGIKTDCAAVLEFLASDAELSKTRLILHGRSLGGAVAIYFTHLAGPSIVKGLILENTFLSIPKLIPSVLPVLSPVSFLCTEVWNSEQVITTLSSQIPILFMSGQQDELVPKEHMATLYDLAVADSKEIVPLKNGTHNDTVVQGGYWEAVAEFCAKV